jgi:hypothetical protein
VEDENGEITSFLWWGGAGENLPPADTKFDIAYTLRGTSFRGQKQVTLQFKEFRVTEEKPIEIRNRESRFGICGCNLPP